MDEAIAKFKTAEECEIFATNWEKRAPERAQESRRRAVQLRAIAHGAKTDAERESLEAIFAYERTLFKKHGKKQRAAYTWRKVRKEGIIASVEAIVLGEKETLGFRALAEEGMLDMAFESVILKHPEVFSEQAVKISRRRLEEWESNAAR